MSSPIKVYSVKKVSLNTTIEYDYIMNLFVDSEEGKLNHGFDIPSDRNSKKSFSFGNLKPHIKHH